MTNAARFEIWRCVGTSDERHALFFTIDLSELRRKTRNAAKERCDVDDVADLSDKLAAQVAILSSSFLLPALLTGFRPFFHCPPFRRDPRPRPCSCGQSPGGPPGACVTVEAELDSPCPPPPHPPPAGWGVVGAPLPMPFHLRAFIQLDYFDWLLRNSVANFPDFVIVGQHQPPFRTCRMLKLLHLSIAFRLICIGSCPCGRNGHS